MDKNYMNAVKETISYGLRRINLNHKLYLHPKSELSVIEFIFFLKKIPFVLMIFKFLESNRLVNRNKCYQIIKKIVHFFKS